MCVEPSGGEPISNITYAIFHAAGLQRIDEVDDPHLGDAMGVSVGGEALEMRKFLRALRRNREHSPSAEGRKNHGQSIMEYARYRSAVPRSPALKWVHALEYSNTARVRAQNNKFSRLTIPALHAFPSVRPVLCRIRAAFLLMLSPCRRIWASGLSIYAAR